MTENRKSKENKPVLAICYDFDKTLSPDDIPILAYEADLSSSNVGITLDSVDYEHKSHLDEFKKIVESSHLISRFTSIDDLGKRITHDVPAELQKLSFIDTYSTPEISDIQAVTEDDLRSGANTFERFWLRPQRVAGRIIPLRLRINRRFGGWKVKDDLIRSVGLSVGDCITTEVSVQLGSNIIDDDGDTDLFADGEGADWIIDQVSSAGIVEGCIIDCFVRLVYCRAPVGQNGKMINKASLVFVSGIRFVEIDRNYVITSNRVSSNEQDILELLSSITS